jgi:hypothetical protein
MKNLLKCIRWDDSLNNIDLIVGEDGDVNYNNYECKL